MSGYGAPYGDIQGAGDLPPRPPTVRQQIRASKEFFEANSHEQIVAVAGLIIARHAGDINQFMLGQRQMGMVLPASYKRADYPDLSMEYQRLSNQETVILTAYPETDNPSAGLLDIEVNYDGYFVWTHCEAGDGTHDNDNFVPGPFDIYFNGYLLEERFAPARPFGGYLLLFGETALLCQSAQDTPHKNIFKTNAEKKDLPLEVTPRPGWGSYDAGSTPAGLDQTKIDKVIGYWVFDWLNPHNPCMSLIDEFGNAGNNQRFLVAAKGNGQNPPNITKGLWFRHADKSPLDHKGSNNNFYVQVSPGGKSGEVLLIGGMFGEFYDRTKGRSVKQSWTKSMRAGYDIIIGDSPLRWGTSYFTGGFFNGTSMAADLTPNNPDNGALGPHDGTYMDVTGGNSLFEQFLSPSDVQKYHAWQQQVQDMQTQYNQQIQQYINAWTQKWGDAAHLKLLNQANNVVAYWQNRVDANGHELPSFANYDDRLRDVQDDGSIVYGPVQQYYFAWNAPYTQTSSNPLPRIGGRYIFSAPFGHPVLIDTNSDPGSPINNLNLYGGSIFGGMALTLQQAFQLADQYVKDPGQNALLQKQQDYDQIAKDHPPPKLPDRPRLGQDYTQFSYRTISGGNGAYSYGEWSGK